MSLEVRDLTIEIDGRRVVDGVSFDVPDGARVGLIGESGSGKSLTALALLGLLPDGATVGGSIRWQGRELLGLPDRDLAAIRGDEIGIVFQEPRTALNPIRTVGRQIAESIRIHEGLGRRTALERAVATARRATADIIGFGGSPRDAHAVSVPYLMLLGTLAGGWMHALAVAAVPTHEGTDETDAARLRAADFYGAHHLPRVHALAETVASGETV